MRLLLDTHALAWWLLDSADLSPHAKRLITDAGNDILVSAVSAFEMATKHRIGKWPEINVLLERFDAMLEDEGFHPLPVKISHGIKAGQLAADHRDPFDRLLAAQAVVEDVSVLTNDIRLKELGARVVW